MTRLEGLRRQQAGRVPQPAAPQLVVVHAGPRQEQQRNAVDAQRVVAGAAGGSLRVRACALSTRADKAAPCVAVRARRTCAGGSGGMRSRARALCRQANSKRFDSVYSCKPPAVEAGLMAEVHLRCRMSPLPESPQLSTAKTPPAMRHACRQCVSRHRVAT